MHETPESEPASACPTPMRMFNANGDVVAVSCDRWKCEICRKVLAHRWGTRVRYGISLHGGPCYHWTLTLPGKVQTPKFAYIVLPLCWDSLRKGLQRECGLWDYAAFVELHPKRRGIAHFHVISFLKSPDRLKDRAHRAGFGYMATEDEVVSHEAAFYVSKYTSKQGAEMPKGFRRVRLSQKWPSLPTPLYDVRLFPLRAKETLGAYLDRIRAATGLDLPSLLARWEHKELDL